MFSRDVVRQEHPEHCRLGLLQSAVSKNRRNLLDKKRASSRCHRLVSFASVSTK